ncbi:sugar transferase [Exiguobacterium aurantiacum]|uniref:Sugar transferase n=1 Tax=Exiguobacterium aurantiacum TaxID=33987 RepID=A0ABY5FQ49_9BACL|nr:sugar transferase [Exiguobacterium aurantiacum]UTT43515.1 sugar transferase [Exiguobacterium aurantiacum]
MKYIEQKRKIDLMLSLIGLVVLAPLFIGIMIAIKLESKGPVFFKQKRVGLHRSHFNILKFRTMRIDAPKDTPTHLLGDPEQYITKVGKFLRKTSLDELPQIINILTGEMSVIGPRPALWNQYDLIEEREKYGANDILPGLTGWAQINGRDELPIEIKAKLDGDYISNIGFTMDVKCFIGTIISVIKREGVIEGGTGGIETTKITTSADSLQAEEAKIVQ